MAVFQKHLTRKTGYTLWNPDLAAYGRAEDEKLPPN